MKMKKKFKFKLGLTGQKKLKSQIRIVNVD